MQYGCVSTLNEIDLLASLGFDYAELHGRELMALSATEVSALHKRLTNANIPCLALNLYCPADIVIAGKNYDLGKATAYAQGLSKRAAELGVENIGIGSPFSRTLPAGFPAHVARMQALDFFKATTEEFSKHGIVVCIEALATCYCNFINTVDSAVEFAKAVDLEACKIVLDFYNMEHMQEADIRLDAYKSYIYHAHISDDAGSPTKRYFLDPQKTNLHMDRMQELKRIGYNRKISLEIDLAVDAHKAQASLSIMRSVFD